jgi:hypothetical protein
LKCHEWKSGGQVLSISAGGGDVTIEAGAAFLKLKLHVKDNIKRTAKTLESFVRN